MSVDRECFLNWCDDKFDGQYVESGDEIKINSPFDPNKDDAKHKLWCNVDGGPEKIEAGVFHCWISKKKGTLVSLVMELEPCSYDRACEILGIDTSLYTLEQQLEKLFFKQEIIIPEPKVIQALQFPEGVHPISEISYYKRKRVEDYLNQRKLPFEAFLYGSSGTYQDRIIIPYYDETGRLVYYNGRHLWKDNPKYLGPPKELGVGKGDVLYCPCWAKRGQDLYITEGEFDAYSLYLSGLNAASVGGANLTYNQIKILKNYKVIISVDSDQAGTSALNRMAELLAENGVRDIRFVRPPIEVKDWNGFLVKSSPSLLKQYATQKIKIYSGFIL